MSLEGLLTSVGDFFILMNISELTRSVLSRIGVESNVHYRAERGRGVTN